VPEEAKNPSNFQRVPLPAAHIKCWKLGQCAWVRECRIVCLRPGSNLREKRASHGMTIPVPVPVPNGGRECEFVPRYIELQEQWHCTEWYLTWQRRSQTSAGNGKLGGPKDSLTESSYWASCAWAEPKVDTKLQHADSTETREGVH